MGGPGDEQKEGWQAVDGSGLLKAKQYHHQELLSTPTRIRHHQPIAPSQVFHEIRRLLGI